MADGPIADRYGFPILADQLDGIPEQSIRIFEAILVQMDSQLEICGRGDLLEQRLFDFAVSGTCEHIVALRNYKMVETCGEASARAGEQCAEVGGTMWEDAACCFNSHQPELHPDDYPHGQCHRHAICSLPSLPILRLYRTGNTVLALAQWSASHSSISPVGCARVGVECISKH